MLLNYENEILTADCGRVKVAYFDAEKKIKVIRTADGELLKETPFTFDFKNFVEEAKTYNIICNSFNH